MWLRVSRSALLLGLMGQMLVPGAGPPQAAVTQEIPQAGAARVVQASTDAVSIGGDPVYVHSELSRNTHVWSAYPETWDGRLERWPVALDAYTLAAVVAPPACHMSVALLAAVGQVETGGLTGHRIDAAHRVVPEIVGHDVVSTPSLRVRDTDAGRWDRDSIWDHALGPMQIMPVVWRQVGIDMDGDGIRDPHNIYDAAGAAMVFLCAGGRDLATAAVLRRAVLAYNHSASYLRAVLAWKAELELRELAAAATQPHFDAWALPSEAVLLRSLSSAAASRHRTVARQALRGSGEGDRPRPSSHAVVPVDPASGPPPAGPTATEPPTPLGFPGDPAAGEVSAPTFPPTTQPLADLPPEKVPLPPCPGVTTDEPVAMDEPEPAEESEPMDQPAPVDAPEAEASQIDADQVGCEMLPPEETAGSY